MAEYTGVFSGRSQYTLRLNVSQGTQNITNNTTQVAASLVITESPEWGSWSNNAASWSVNIDGNTYSGSFTYDFRNYNSLTLWSGTVTVTHNADGTKSISSSASVGGSTTIGNASASGTLALTTIPRASNSTFSVSAVDAGTAFTITTNRASTSFTHTLRYSFGSLSNQTIATGVGASYSWTPPLSLLNQIPSATSGTMTITTITFSGSTQIGSTTRNITIRAGAAIVPSFTAVTATEATAGVASVVGAFVQNVSTLALAITGEAGIYGSTITSRVITAAGFTINAASGTTGLLPTSGIVTVTATITDSRGRTSTDSINVNVLAYSAPAIAAGSPLVRRSSAGGVVFEEGDSIRVDLNASVASLINGSQRNTISYRVSTRLRGESIWSIVTTATPAGITYNNSFVIGGTYATSSSWEVRVEVIDKFRTTTVLSTVATSNIFMHWGEGLGVGKFHEQGGLDVAGSVFQNNGQEVEPAGNISVTARSTPPPGWLLCNGAAVSRAAYPRLFEAIGTSFGAGNGSTTFNVPNLLGRVVVGMNPSEAEFNTLGKTGGAKTHTLSVGEMPSHTHTQNSHNHTQNSHTHGGFGGNGVMRSNSTASGNASAISTTGHFWSAVTATGGTTATNQATTATNQDTGGGGAHNNLQPYAAMPYIIKT